MDQQNQYHPLPQPEEIDKRQREDAMGAYLMMFAAIGAGLPLPILNLIAAVIYYFVNRHKSRFVHFHSLQSLLSQIPTSLLNAGAVFWFFRIFFGEPLDEREIGLPVFPNEFVGYVIMVGIVNLLYFVFSIIAAVKARQGRFYYLIFFGRVAYEQVYRIRESASMAEARNLPPS